MREVGLVVLREVRERLRDRAFLLSNLFLLALVLGAVLVPAALDRSAEPYRLAAVGEEAVAASRGAAAGMAVPVELSVMSDPAVAERAVRSGDVDAVLLDPGTLLAGDPSDVPPGLLSAVAAARQRLAVDRLLTEAGVGPAERAEAQAARAVTVRAPAAEPGQEQAGGGALGPDYLLGLAAVGMLYLLINLYGQWVAQGIIEEKSSRVVELLVSSMRPRELLAGKILGVGIIGLAQVALTTGVGLGAALASGLTLPERAPVTLGLVVAWYLLGYFLYATLFAVAGALVSRVEDLQSTAMPLFALTIGAFIAAQAAAQDPTSTWATIAGLVPFTAPLVQPLLMAAGAADPLSVVAAIALCLGLIAVLVPLAARAYTGGVLRLGGRVRLRDALRSSR